MKNKRKIVIEKKKYSRITKFPLNQNIVEKSSGIP